MPGTQTNGGIFSLISLKLTLLERLNIQNWYWAILPRVLDGVNKGKWRCFTNYWVIRNGKPPEDNEKRVK
jgi:hypothetical protein